MEPPSAWMERSDCRLNNKNDNMANQEDQLIQILSLFKDDQRRMNAAKLRMNASEVKKALYYEPVTNHQDIIQLKYLADAGVPEAMLTWAKFCYYGKYTAYDRVKAYSLVYELLNKLTDENFPAEKRAAFLRDNLSPDDPFLAEVIEHRHANQFGTAFWRKIWFFGNQTRLAFMRFALVINNERLNDARAHPALGCTAFLFFFIRLGKELGQLIRFYHRDREKRQYRAEELQSTNKANREYVKRFLVKDGRPLRFWNDIMWSCFGTFGFTVELLLFTGVITTASPAVFVSALSVVVGFTAELLIEIVRTYQEVNALNHEIRTLNRLIQGMDGDDPQKQLLSDRVTALEKKMRKDILKHTVNITATAVIAIGMLLARLLPMVCTIDPLIGALFVFVMSSLWLVFRVVNTILEYRQEKLTSKLENSCENIKELYSNQVPEGHRLAKLESEINERAAAKAKPSRLSNLRVRFTFWNRNQYRRLESDSDRDDKTRYDLATFTAK